MKSDKPKDPVRAIFLAAMIVLSLPAMVGGMAFVPDGDHSGIASANTSPVDTQNETFEDFETENLDGWDVVEGNPEFIDDSFYGSTSLKLTVPDEIEWIDGATTNTNDGNEWRGTIKPETVDDFNMRLGLIDPEESNVDRVALRFNSNDETVINIRTSKSGYNEFSDDAIETNFEDEWVDFRIKWDDGEMKVKVWEAGTSEPDDWQIVEDVPEATGNFAFDPGSTSSDRTMYIDRINLAGEDVPVTAQVTDQSGNPVDNATVEAWGLSPAPFDTDNVENIAEEIQSLEQDLTDLESEEWEEFSDEFADGSATGMLDSDAYLSDIGDTTYPLVHHDDDWNEGFTTILSDEVDDPRIQVDNDEDLVLSLWDPEDDGGWVDTSPVRSSQFGAPTEGTIVVEQLGPTGVEDTRELDTQVEFVENRNFPYEDREWHAVRTSLPEGVYQAYPEDNSAARYTFTVGQPDDIFDSWASDLENRITDLTEREEIFEDEIELREDASFDELLDEGIAQRQRETTNESGYVELDGGSVQYLNLQAYKADDEILDVLEEITDTEDPSFDDVSISDFRDYRLDYNGSFYLPAETKRVDTSVQDSDVTLDVRRTIDLPLSNMEEFEDLQQWLEDEFLDQNISEFSDDLLDDMELEELEAHLEDLEEFHNTSEFLDDIEELEDTLEEDGLEAVIKQAIEDIEDDADDEDLEQLIEDLIDEYDDDGLDEDDIEAIVDDAVGDQLDEDDIEDLIEELDTGIDEGELLDQIEELQSQIDELESIAPGDGDGDISDGLLEFTQAFPMSIDDAVVTLEYEDGETESVPEEYVSIQSAGILSGDEVVIDGYEIDDERALADVRIQTTGDEGIGSGGGAVPNPDFTGDVAELDAVQLSTTAPGPSETVRMDLNPSDATEFDEITDVEAFDADNNPIDADIDDDDRVSFRTDGEGVHTIRATYLSSSGDEFRVSETVRAGESPGEDRSTIRAGQTAAGPHAVIGPDLENARIAEADDGTLEFDAIIERGENPPGELHLMPGEILSGDTHEIDLEIFEGDAEQRIEDTHVAVQVHLDDYAEDAQAWRGDNAIYRDGDTRHGEVQERDDGKAIITTYTDENGELSLEVEEDPGPLDRLRHAANQYWPSWGDLSPLFIGDVLTLETIALETTTQATDHTATLETTLMTQSTTTAPTPMATATPSGVSA